MINKKTKEPIGDRELDNITNSINNSFCDYSFSDVIYQTISHVILDSSYWYVSGDEDLNIPSQIRVLNPATVSIYADELGREQKIDPKKTANAYKVSRYTAKFGNASIELEKERVIHIKKPSVHNTLSGMGVIQRNQALFDYVGMYDVIVEKFQRSGTLKNLLFQPELSTRSPETIKEVLAAFKENIQGQSNFFESYALPEGKITQLENSLDSLRFDDHYRQSREFIMSCFRIPALYYDSAQAKFDSSREQKNIFYQSTIRDAVSLFQGAFNIYLSRWFSDQFEFKFIVPEIKDPIELRENLRLLYSSGALTANEMRTALGFEPDDNNVMGDSYFLPFNLVPSDEPNTQPAIEDTETEETETEKSICSHTKMTRLHARFLRTAQRTMRNPKNISKFENSIEKYYGELKGRILGALSKKSVKDIGDVLDFDFEKEKKIASKEAKNVMTSVMTLSLKDLGSFIDLDFDDQNPNKFPGFTLTLDKLGKSYADLTLDTRRNELKSLVERASEEGMSTSRLSDEIEDLFNYDKTQAWKASRIARTEISNAYQRASQIGYKELGIKYEMVVGCQEPDLSKWDCATNGESGIRPVGSDWNFKPNHTGTIVPVIEE
ncbi:hypothetical protein CL622_03010 [archaeon]|nr:hypothetical protein [archaeon]